MQKVVSGCLLSLTLALALSRQSPRARKPIPPHPTRHQQVFSLDDQFKFGSREFSLGVAPMFSPLGNDFNRPVVNWVEGYAQLGYMVTDIHLGGFLHGLFRGNVEAVGEAFGGGIWEETGHYIAGGSIMARYQFHPRVPAVCARMSRPAEAAK